MGDRFTVLTHCESVPRPLDLPLEVSHPALEQHVVALAHRLVLGALAEVLLAGGGRAAANSWKRDQIMRKLGLEAFSPTEWKLGN